MTEVTNRAAQLAAFALSACLATPALASDYYNECSSSDGQFQIHDGDLKVIGHEDDQETPYEVLSEVVLQESEGYCLTASTGDQRFGFESRLSVQKIRLEINGYPVETTVLCEMIGDGLPAALGCDQRFVTKDIDQLKR